MIVNRGQNIADDVTLRQARHHLEQRGPGRARDERAERRAEGELGRPDFVAVRQAGNGPTVGHFGHCNAESGVIGRIHQLAG